MATPNTKPREFWVTLKHDGEPTHIALHKPYQDLNQLHVIEKSAYLSATQDLAEIRRKYDELVKLKET